MNSLTVGSLFSGIGGFELGFQRQGMETLWQCEIDKHPQSVLRRHWPSTEIISDVRKLTAGDVQRPDLICGGFPCQDLSMAGKRKGLGGKRSGLWFQFHRVIGEIRPAWVVVENVPGLRSSDGGRDLLTIIRGLAKFGYMGSWWSPNAQYFGVAQRRRRVFIVGRLRDDGPPPILFDTQSLRRDTAPVRETGSRLAAPVDDGAQPSGREVVVGTINARAAREPDGAAAGHLIPIVNALTSSGVGTCGVDDNQAQAGHLVAYQCHGSNVGPMGTLRAGNGNEAGGVPFIARPLRAQSQSAHDESLQTYIPTHDVAPCIQERPV